MLERKADELLAAKGLLPNESCRCRYCQAPIELDVRECPHCHRSLAPLALTSYRDPWQLGYDERLTRKVDLMNKPRPGCLAVLFLAFTFVSALRLLIQG